MLGSTFPEKSQKLLELWKKYHPEWEIRLWTDKEVQSLMPLINQQSYDTANNFGEKSDIARYEILYRFEGLYVDHDFICLKSFEDLHYRYDFYAGIGHVWQPLFCNSLMGSCAHHPILKLCIDQIYMQQRNPLCDEKFFDIQLRTGPYLLTRCALNYLNKTTDSKALFFPVTFFYSLPNTLAHLSVNEAVLHDYIKPESYALHLWNSSWVG